MRLLRTYIFVLMMGAAVPPCLLAQHLGPREPSSVDPSASASERKIIDDRFLAQTKKTEPLSKAEIDRMTENLSEEESQYLSEFPLSQKFAELGNATWEKNIVALWGNDFLQRAKRNELDVFEALSDRDIEERIGFIESLTTGNQPDEALLDLGYFARKLKKELELRKEEKVDSNGDPIPREFSEFRQAVHTSPDAPPLVGGRVPLQPIEVDKEKVLWITFGERICKTGAMEAYRHMANALPDAKHFSVESIAQLESLRSTIADLINNQGYRHVVISGHGSPYGMTIGASNNLVPQNAQWFGSIFKGATDVRMISCELGSANGVLRGIAKGADAAVTGSTGIVYTTHNGQKGFIGVPLNSQWVSIVPHARRGEAANDKDKAKYLASYRDPSKPPEGAFPKPGGGIEYVNPGSLIRDNGPTVGPDGRTRDAAERAREMALRNLAMLGNQISGQSGGGRGGGGAGGSGGGNNASNDSAFARGLEALGADGFTMPNFPRDGQVSEALLAAYARSRRTGPKRPIDFNVGTSATETVDKILKRLYSPHEHPPTQSNR